MIEMGPVFSFTAKFKVKGKKRKEKRRVIHVSNRMFFLGSQGAYSSILFGRLF
jgi:hypothetical protein